MTTDICTQDHVPICDHDKSFGLLVSDIGRLLRKLFDGRIREKTGLSSAQWAVLLQLRLEDGLTQIKLAEMVEIEQSSLVRHLDNLEQMGLIKRVPAADRRINNIHLTPASGDIFKKVSDVVIPLRDELLKDIDQKDLDTTLACLRQVKEKALSMQQETSK